MFGRGVLNLHSHSYSMTIQNTIFFLNATSRAVPVKKFWVFPETNPHCISIKSQISRVRGSFSRPPPPTLSVAGVRKDGIREKIKPISSLVEGPEVVVLFWLVQKQYKWHSSVLIGCGLVVIKKGKKNNIFLPECQQNNGRILLKQGRASTILWFSGFYYGAIMYYKHNGFNSNLWLVKLGVLYSPCWKKKANSWCFRYGQIERTMQWRKDGNLCEMLVYVLVLAKISWYT